MLPDNSLPPDYRIETIPAIHQSVVRAETPRLAHSIVTPTPISKTKPLSYAQVSQISETFPYKPKWHTTKTVAIGALLGKHTPGVLFQKSVFGVDESFSDYLALPESAFQSTTVSLAKTWTFAPKDHVLIPMGYAPPVGDKPVIVLSMGANGRLPGYAQFIDSLRAQGYGVLGYQYGFLESTGKHISDNKISFSTLEDWLVQDLDHISQALNAGSFTMSDGQTVSVSPVPYERQIFVGHSFGGIISADVQAMHPERAYPKLFLIATPSSFYQAFQNILKSEIHKPVYYSISKKRAGAILKDSLSLKKTLPKIKTPIVFIQGSDDHLVRHDTEALYQHWTSETASEKPDFYVVPKADHMNILYLYNGDNHQQEVTDLIRKELQQMESTW